MNTKNRLELAVDKAKKKAATGTHWKKLKKELNKLSIEDRKLKMLREAIDPKWRTINF